MIDLKKIYTSFDYPQQLIVGEKTVKCESDDGLDILVCIYENQDLIYQRTCEAFFVDKKNRIVFLHSLLGSSLNSCSLHIYDSELNIDYTGVVYKDQVFYYAEKEIMIAKDDAEDIILFTIPFECTDVYFLEDDIFCMSENHMVPVILDYRGQRNLRLEKIFLKNTAYEYFVVNGIVHQSDCNAFPGGETLSIAFIDNLIIDKKPNERYIKLWDEMKNILLTCGVEYKAECAVPFYNIARICLIENLYKNSTREKSDCRESVCIYDN